QSHVAIVAKALGIAAVGQARGIVDRVTAGDAAIVDAMTGEVHLRPSSDVIAAYSDKVRFLARRQRQYRALKDVPAVTTDGVKIDLHINAGLLVDMPHLRDSGADGVGLFRTELLFMLSNTLPKVDRQTDSYRAIIARADGKPVVFRTLDIGGDKVLPYLRSVEEENPALGWRAIRLSLDRPGLLRAQVRALLRAAAGRELRIMFPMVAIVSEFDNARALVERELTYLRRHGHRLPNQVMVGVMLEVPSLLFALDDILERADFLSVGSNDLVQFLFAADRGNAQVANRFDPLTPPGLRVLKMIADTCKKHGKPFTLCGELAAKPLEAMALIALGFRSLSLSPAMIGPVKAMILALNAGDAEKAILPLLKGGSAGREKLRAFATEAGIPV
ncbi:MAG: phosphoenolpyruvate--protein phosphotransferase, partial [Hyphomicrobium sp.]|nr:phosphoenolpyruvate--protein phosphotransferase [Hyphomicrobium sp.]